VSYTLCLCGYRCEGATLDEAHDVLAAHVERAHGTYRLQSNPTGLTVQPRKRARVRAKHGHPSNDSP
jgi:hypothetical protein